MLSAWLQYAILRANLDYETIFYFFSGLLFLGLLLALFVNENINWKKIYLFQDR